MSRRHVWLARPGIFLAVLITALGLTLTSVPPAAAGFNDVAVGGIGDPGNSYPWSVAYYDDCVFVGTNRHFLAAIQTFVFADTSGSPSSGTDPVGPVGSQDWADDMRAEIWRYCKNTSPKWQMVFQSPTVQDLSNLIIPVPKIVPVYHGFRSMAVFNGYICAGSGIGVYPFPASIELAPGALLLCSTSGEAGTWNPVFTPPDMRLDSRSLVVFDNHLCMALANPSTFIPFPPIRNIAEVWCTPSVTNPGPSWTKVADFNTAGPGVNFGVTELQVFNDYLYAGTANITGYQVWRSTTKTLPTTTDWTQLVTYGGGDMANTAVASMVEFKKKLYVSSMSQPLDYSNFPLEPEADIQLAKGAELIYIKDNDAWHLVIGDYVPVKPPPVGPQFRLPLSWIPGGFGNPLNFYFWDLVVHRKKLYLGTFTFLATQIGTIEEFLPPGIDIASAIGSDVWKSKNGRSWDDVTLNGFGNPRNYGVRNMLSAYGDLWIFFANPYEGLEVWRD